MPNVNIKVEDFTQQPWNVRQVVMTPLYSYTVDGNNIVPGDRLVRRTDANGSVTFSGVVSGAYELEFIGSHRITPLEILVSGTGTLNAKDLIGIRLSGLSASEMAYSMAQSDVRFAAKGDAISANPTFSGLVTINDYASNPIGLKIYHNNSDYTNTSGSGSHITLVNPNLNAQTVVSSVRSNGTLLAKWRTDYVGNISWVSLSSHDFYVGGDYGVGNSVFKIYADSIEFFGTAARVDLNGTFFGNGVNVYYDADNQQGLLIDSSGGIDTFGPISTISTIAASSATVSSLTVNGDAGIIGNISTQGLACKLVTKTSNYTLTYNDYTVVANGTITLYLPTAVGHQGKIFTVKQIANLILTVTADASAVGQTIDGASSKTLGQWKYLTVQSDGANWLIIGQN